MSDFRIASRYAKSLLELAQEKGVLDKVYDDMLAFDHLCKANRDFTMMLKNPIIQHHKKLVILKKLFEGRFNTITMTIFEIITRKNREFVLPAISAEFVHQYSRFKGITEATVTTKFALTQDLRKEFMKVIKGVTKQEVVLDEKVNPDMLGGFIVRIGDLQIDDSLDSRLEELRSKLISSTYIRKF